MSSFWKGENMDNYIKNKWLRRLIVYLPEYIASIALLITLLSTGINVFTRYVLRFTFFWYTDITKWETVPLGGEIKQDRWKSLKTKRILTVITAITLSITAASAVGEIHSKDIESNGKIIETIWMDDNGQTTSGPEGYATVRYTYKRELTTEEYLDMDGQPVQTAGGYYRKAVTRDGKGNVIQI